MDSVEGKKKTKKTVLALTERKSRDELFRLMPSKTSESVVKQLDKIERQVGTEKFKQIFKSITVDNGSEFMDVDGIERSVFTGEKRTQVYRCHPYSSNERGSNENQNRMLRRWKQKGTDFTNVTEEEIQKIEDWTNNYPRKMFGFCSAADVAEAWLNSILEN
ncbi:MAG: IS30 family transposase [Oscillospiraceae bacterium]|nr:IS30 family transposase [Oscillospiraceae bacterium]